MVHAVFRWPKDGVLRVEILRPGEIKTLLKDGADEMELTKLRGVNYKGGLENIDPSSTFPHEESSPEIMTLDKIDLNQTFSSEEISLTKSYRSELAPSIDIKVSGSGSSTNYAKFAEETIDMTNSETNTKETYTNETIARINDHAYEEPLLKSDEPEVEKLNGNSYDQYIVECKQLHGSGLIIMYLPLF